MIKAKISFSGGAEDLKNNLDAAAREGLEAAAEHWHNFIREEHFEPSAVAKYGYTKRSKGYMLQKAKKHGHQNPLEFTGESRAASRSVRISATAKRGTLAFLALPKYFYQTNKKLTTIDKAAELVAVNDSDAQAMAAAAEKPFIEELLKRRPVKTVSIA